MLVKELQSLALDVRVLDKQGNEIELSQLCQEEDAIRNTSKADADAIDDVLNQGVVDEALRQSFLMEDEDGNLEDDEGEEDEYFDQLEDMGFDGSDYSDDEND